MAKKKKKLSETEKRSERLRKKLHKNVEEVFVNSGLISLPSKNVEAEIAGQKGEFDGVFVFKNLIIFSEDTTDAGPNDHLRKKVEFFRHCVVNRDDTIQFLKKKFIKFKNGSGANYGDADFHLVFVYASHKCIDKTHKKPYSKDTVFLDQKSLSYFLSLSKTIKKSTRFELLKFLDVDFDKIGNAKSASAGDMYTALVLPETPSGFPKGHLLISFLIDPNTLLQQSYVLRKDGWLDNDCVYQRILVKNKILNMRDYLTKEGRVFVNNVIVTLPDDVQFYDKNGKVVTPPMPGRSIKDPIKFSIPRVASNIGIIDGQHRVFSYHEGDDAHEKQISQMRETQHLLVTGIMYPEKLSQDDRTRFEAKLFLEINDKQTRTKAALRQVIGTIVNPFSEISIAKMVVNELAKRDPMKDVLEQHFFDTGKLKTTSIVSYGMKHVVKLSGTDSFYNIWSNSKKNALANGKNRKLLNQYVEFCSDEINVFLRAFKKNIPDKMWTVDQKMSRVLTATTITGVIHCMRVLIEKNKRGDFGYYDKGFRKLTGKIDFTPERFTYKSSHWKDLGDKIYDICFK